jgi:hypothetical protein
MPWHTLSFKCVTRKSGPQPEARGAADSSRPWDPTKPIQVQVQWGAADQHEPGKGLLLRNCKMLSRSQTLRLRMMRIWSSFMVGISTPTINFVVFWICNISDFEFISDSPDKISMDKK